MEVYRLQRAKHGAELSGSGAALKGARWNSPGTEIVYTAQSRALAMAEIAVHFTLATLPSDYRMFTIFIPDIASFTIVPVSDLPHGWNSNPPPLTCQAIGDDFIRRRKFCLLKIPSAVVEGDFNILINPNHNEFSGIKVVERTPFRFDNRLWER